MRALELQLPSDMLGHVETAKAPAWKAAQKFEAMTLSALLQPMFNSANFAGAKFGKNLLGEGKAEEAWLPVLTQAIGQQMSARGGVGLAEPVFNQLLRIQVKLP